MAQHHIQAREYKLMLQASHFDGDEAAVVRQAGRYWTLVRELIHPLGFDTDGRLDELEHRRELRFHDTSDRRLASSGYVFRERTDCESGKREVTLKFRHPDRYVAEAHVLEPRAEGNKFEEDITWPFRSLYSFSLTREIAREKKLNHMDDPGRLHPSIPELLDGYDEREALLVVGDFTARELVIKGADFQIGERPKLEAKCALVVWYAAAGDTEKPLLVEFSFKYDAPERGDAAGVARRAYDVFKTLASDRFARWLATTAQTKTQYVYDLAARHPRRSEAAASVHSTDSRNNSGARTRKTRRIRPEKV